MKEPQFIKKQEPAWRELEDLEGQMRRMGKLKRGKSSVRAAQTEVINRFFTAYRDASHDLSYAKTHYPKSSVVPYLNELVGRCHSLMYERKPLTFKQFIRSITVDFPNRFKSEWQLVLAAFLVFMVGAAVGAIMVMYNENAANYFLPEGMMEQMKTGKMGEGEWNYPLMSAIIMTNNIKVSISAFVFGIFLGLGTLYVLFYNGAMLGALTTLVYAYADPLRFWSLILPHGITELLAIFIAGGAGLMLARAMFMPGHFKRVTAIVFEAKRAMVLLWGCVLLLVAAGLIEGFITPLDIPIVAKYGVALVTALLLVILLLRKTKGERLA